MPPKSLSRLFRVDEMANTRKGPTWAVLDWAAQQTGEFSLKDLFAVYQKAGGEQGYTSFHTTIGHMTAKPWKDDQGKYALSDDRPFAVAKKGSRGAGGATSLRWGLDHALRDAPEAEAELDGGGEGDDEGTSAIGDALDRLEVLMGRDKLKAAVARWRGMRSIHQAVADIRASVPMKGQMDALHVAYDSLVHTGKANDADVTDAENELDYVTPPADAPGGTSQKGTPFTVPKAEPAKPDAAPTTFAEPKDPVEPEDDSDDEDDSDLTSKPTQLAPTSRPAAPPVHSPTKKHKGWGKK